jgi:hypothetical protein
MRANVVSFEEWVLSTCLLITAFSKTEKVEPFIYFAVSFFALLSKIILQRKERVEKGNRKM